MFVIFLVELVFISILYSHDTVSLIKCGINLLTSCKINHLFFRLKTYVFFVNFQKVYFFRKSDWIFEHCQPCFYFCSLVSLLRRLKFHLLNYILLTKKIYFSLNVFVLGTTSFQQICVIFASLPFLFKFLFYFHSITKRSILLSFDKTNAINFFNVPSEQFNV